MASTNSSKLDTSDIVLGVTKPGNTSDYLVKDIAFLLRRSSSAPCNWHVDGDERRQQLSYNNRYYNLSNRVCSICLKKGHNAGECSRLGPVCILCGRDGHLSHQCPTVYCCICLQQGHSSSSCSNQRRQLKSKCKMCRQTGHSENVCSEAWRQYRSMTLEGEPSFTENRVRKKFCCNCGRRGHEFEDCRCKRFRRRYLIQKPLRHQSRLPASKAAHLSAKEKTGSRVKNLASKSKHNSQKIDYIRVRRKASLEEESASESGFKRANKRVEKKLFQMALNEVHNTWKKKDEIVYRYSHETRSHFSGPSEVSNEAEYLSFNASPLPHRIHEQNKSTRNSMRQDHRPFKDNSAADVFVDFASSSRARYPRSAPSKNRKNQKPTTDLGKFRKRRYITESDFDTNLDEENFKIVQRHAESKMPRRPTEWNSRVNKSEQSRNNSIFHSTPSHSVKSWPDECLNDSVLLPDIKFAASRNRSVEDEEWYRKTVRQSKLAPWNQPRKRRFKTKCGKRSNNVSSL